MPRLDYSLARAAAMAKETEGHMVDAEHLAVALTKMPKLAGTPARAAAKAKETVHFLVDSASPVVAPITTPKPAGIVARAAAKAREVLESAHLAVLGAVLAPAVDYLD
jgi:hypothetical protein